MAQPVRATAAVATIEAVKANRFAYLTLNMHYTTDAWNANPQNRCLRVAHVIARVTLIPFLLIASSEALVKNGCFLVANLGIAIVNIVDSLICSRKKAPPLPAPPPPDAAPGRSTLNPALQHPPVDRRSPTFDALQQLPPAVAPQEGRNTPPPGDGAAPQQPPANPLRPETPPPTHHEGDPANRSKSSLDSDDDESTGAPQPQPSPGVLRRVLSQLFRLVKDD